MRKMVLATAMSLVAIGGWVIGSAASGAAGSNHDYERVAAFDPRGFSSFHCDTSPCPIPLYLVTPFNFHELGATYDAVVTMSFTYRTSAKLRLSVGPSLYERGGSRVSLDSADRYLTPATKARSATLTWLIPLLTGGQGYTVNLAARPDGSAPADDEFSFTNITTVIEGAPA